MSASLIGRLGSSAFQVIHHPGVDVARGLALLFGIGSKALPVWGFEDEVEQSLGRPCRLADSRSKRTYELTSSIVPRGTSFHCRVELGFPPIGFDPVRVSCSCCGLLSGLTVTSFHHQPEAQHPNSSAINKLLADYPIFGPKATFQGIGPNGSEVPKRTFRRIAWGHPPSRKVIGSIFRCRPFAAERLGVPIVAQLATDDSNWYSTAALPY